MLKLYSKIAAYALVAMALTSCAKEEFQKQTVQATAAAVGFRQIPAKVDILIVPDNSPSVNGALSTVQSKLGSFVSSLQNQYWDYHVAKSFIVNPSPIREVLVNPEFNTRFLKDGTDIGTSHMVVAPYARTNPNAFSLLPSTTTASSNDRTYENTYNNLVEVTTTGAAVNFLRPDAMLAIIVVTNGAEGSVDSNGNGAIDSSSAWSLLEQYAESFKSLKNYDERLIRFYPIASYALHNSTTGTSCLAPGGTALPGGSYFAMNNYIPGLPMYNTSGGEILNFCNSGSLNNVLGDIAANLNIIKQAYVHSNIVLDEEPIESTLVVSKNGQTLAKDPTNGWQYRGFGTVYTITHILDESGTEQPIFCPGSTTQICGLNRKTGYVIELNGSARMVGSDVPGVSYEAR